MKNSNLFKAITLLAIVLIFGTFSANAANYYAYKGKQVTINGGGTFAAYKWILVSQPAAAGSSNSELTAFTTSTLTQTFTVEGAYKLRLLVKNADGCWSDVDTSTDIDIFVLPDFTVSVALDGTSAASYCTNGDAASRTKLLASATPVTGSVALPSEVTISLAAWYKTQATGSITSLTALTTANPYTVTETTVGTHYFVATGKYIIPAGRLISAAGDAIASAAFTVTVTAAPTTPAITPVVTN